MQFSFKDIKFILEELEYLLNRYNRRMQEIEDLEEYEDEISDLDNDYLFVESLKSEIAKSISQNKAVGYDILSETPATQNLKSTIKSASQLSINERLLLVEAITQSIRKETDLIAS